MFKQVCGEAALKNAVLLITHCDKVGDKAVKMEQQLVTSEKYFKPLCDFGATPFRHNDEPASAQQVMIKLLTNIPIPPQLQEDVRAGKTLEETAAGNLLGADLSDTIKKHGAKIKKLREELQEAIKAGDKSLQKELTDEIAELEETVKRLTASKEHLKQPPYVHFFDSYMTSLKMFSERSKSNIWRRFMRAGGEGARGAGFLGRCAGFGGAAIGEGYLALKIGKAALSRGKTVKEAKQEFEREYEHVMAKAATMSEVQGGGKLTRLARGTAGYVSGAMDVFTSNVPQ
jgi:hypothetical protein